MIPTAIRIHGSLMVIGWIFCCTNGIILSRHYKQSWKRKGRRNYEPWLIAHQVFNSIAVICSILGTFVIVYFSQDYSNLTPYPVGAHPICGFISTALSLLNPLIALCRCSPTSSNRTLFNWIHTFVGLTAFSLAVPAIALGLIVLRSTAVKSSPYSILTVFQGFVILYVITEMTLEFTDYWMILRERSKSAF
ncbi:hypothetical protein FBUS_07593 [Fasciolopsis buskii]|uniref:ascorbate ferrireductase (transmembrane) n=1 Tax=Fasciolopsis buskii TaxID=27845 RepID=A0A8E0RPD0_9TREM|nr:hypothetical protein FBUS_07593 [Fasciolopsis buski]